LTERAEIMAVARCAKRTENTRCEISILQSRKVGEVRMKKEYIVELREEEANELMDSHWVGELVRCKDCKYLANMYKCPCFYSKEKQSDDWFCAEGERK